MHRHLDGYKWPGHGHKNEVCFFWNTILEAQYSNENPSTDKLSGAINYGVEILVMFNEMRSKI